MDNQNQDYILSTLSNYLKHKGDVRGTELVENLLDSLTRNGYHTECNLLQETQTRLSKEIWGSK